MPLLSKIKSVTLAHNMKNQKLYGMLPKNSTVRETINYDTTWPNLWVFDEEAGATTVIPFFADETLRKRYSLDMEDISVKTSFDLVELHSSPFHIASSPGKFFEVEYFMENQNEAI